MNTGTGGQFTVWHESEIPLMASIFGAVIKEGEPAGNHAPVDVESLRELLLQGNISTKVLSKEIKRTGTERVHEVLVRVHEAIIHSCVTTRTNEPVVIDQVRPAATKEADLYRRFVDGAERISLFF